MIVVNMRCLLVYVHVLLCTLFVSLYVDSCGSRHVQAPPLPPHHLHWQYMCVSGHLPISSMRKVLCVVCLAIPLSTVQLLLHSWSCWCAVTLACLTVVVKDICYHANEPALFSYWTASVLCAGTAQEVQILILSIQPNPTLVTRWALFSHTVHFNLSCVEFSLPTTYLLCYFVSQAFCCTPPHLWYYYSIACVELFITTSIDAYNV